MIDDKDKQSIPECGSNGLPKRHACGLRPITPAHCLRHASLNSTFFNSPRGKPKQGESSSVLSISRAQPILFTANRRPLRHLFPLQHQTAFANLPKNRNHSFSRTLLIGARFSSILQCKINRKFGSDISRQRLSRLRQLLKLFLQTRRTS